MLGIYWLLVVNQPQWCKWGQVARVWSARIASYRDVCGFWVSEVKPWALRGWGTDLKMYLEPHTEVQHFYTKVLFLACIYQCYPSGKVRADAIYSPHPICEEDACIKWNKLGCHHKRSSHPTGLSQQRSISVILYVWWGSAWQLHFRWLLGP